MEIIGAMEGRGKHAGILGNLMVRAISVMTVTSHRIGTATVFPADR